MRIVASRVQYLGNTCCIVKVGWALEYVDRFFFTNTNLAFLTIHSWPLFLESWIFLVLFIPFPFHSVLSLWKAFVSF